MNIDIKSLARLCMVCVEEEKIADFSRDVENLVKNVESLPPHSTVGAPTQPVAMEMREDVAAVPFEREGMLKNAPRAENGFIVVPRPWRD